MQLLKTVQYNSIYYGIVSIFLIIVTTNLPLTVDKLYFIPTQIIGIVLFAYFSLKFIKSLIRNSN